MSRGYRASTFVEDATRPDFPLIVVLCRTVQNLPLPLSLCSCFSPSLPRWFVPSFPSPAYPVDASKLTFFSPRLPQPSSPSSSTTTAAPELVVSPSPSKRKMKNHSPRPTLPPNPSPPSEPSPGRSPVSSPLESEEVEESTPEEASDLLPRRLFH